MERDEVRLLVTTDSIAPQELVREGYLWHEFGDSHLLYISRAS